MWFLFGFITLISFTVYVGTKRYQNSWAGQFRTSGSLRFEYRIDIQKDKTNAFKVGVGAPKEFDFSFKRENAIDRFCKWLGLSVEYQLGKIEFDNLVYVVSNDSHFLRNVVSDPTVVDAVTRLFRNVRQDCIVSEVRCAAGRLTATVKVGGASRDESQLGRLHLLLPVLAGWLEQVAQQLKEKPPRAPSAHRDRFIVRASILLALSSGLLVNGLVHGFRLLWIDEPFTLDVEQLWILAALGGFALVTLMVFAAFSALGRSARTHLVLIEILIAGSIGATLTVFTEIRDLNIEMDTSKAQKLVTQVVGKSTSRSRKGRTRYYILVHDWNKADGTQKIKVTSNFYSSIQAGQKIMINQHEGALGMRWVHSYEHAPNF